MSTAARKPKVMIALSGGVDSAVAAVSLLEQGYPLEALHMTNWDADDSYCTAAEDLQEARRVATDLGIPFHHVNFAQEYREQVFADFLAEYAAGRTPNPDIACNRYIKFGVFRDYAQRLGAERIATGHYARIGTHEGQPALLKGVDQRKDQSYFLHAVRPEVLGDTLFPLGELEKTEVRRLANDAGLRNHARRDSTGICFIGERPFREFLEEFLPAQPGEMRTPEGTVVGTHDGLMYYTLGQRQGLGIGGSHEGTGEPWFVAGKDLASNELIVVQGRQHPLLWSTALVADPVDWLAAPPENGARLAVKTRYRQPDVPCTLTHLPEGRIGLSFNEPVWSVTPGQYAVLYDGDVCLGGSPITEVTGVSQGENISALQSA